FRHHLGHYIGIVPQKESLLLCQLVEVIGFVFDVTVCRDKEAARSCRWILDQLPRLGLHQGDDAVDQWARGEVLPRSGLLVGSILLKQTFIEIAKALFA